MQVATDLFEFQGKMFLLIIDYYSRWIEVLSLAESNHCHNVFEECVQWIGNPGHCQVRQWAPIRMRCIQTIRLFLPVYACYVATTFPTE